MQTHEDYLIQSINEIIESGEAAKLQLLEMAEVRGHDNNASEVTRLMGKREGVELVLGKLRRMLAASL